jgi:hypothetical protein
MLSARSEADLLTSLRELVQDNAETLFGVTGNQLRVEHMSLSKAFHRKHDRYHRALTVHYSRDGETREKRIWLKFLADVRTLYDIHTAVWNQNRDGSPLFPQPYFYGQWSGGEMIGMELVEGAPLRGLLLRRAFTRRSPVLSPVFAALGEALRAFHDSSKPAGFRSVDDLEENARRGARGTEHLTRAERERMLQLIASAAVRAGGSRTRLPLIPVHHDCTLRNVVVNREGSPRLVDLDSMVAPWKSRWHDVAVFLDNLESQVRYAPLVDAGAIATSWRSFWSGYAGVALPNDLSPAQVDALLFLMKVEYVFDGPWRPLFETYTGVLASRYLRRLKLSLLRGEHRILETDAVAATCEQAPRV